MGNYDKHFWGSREQREKISGSREHELKTYLGTRAFINGEQGIKSKKIKGSWEHVPPPGRGSLVHKPGFSFNSLRFELVVSRIKQKTLKKSECETLYHIHCE